jgi:hypothetical protein
MRLKVFATAFAVTAASIAALGLLALPADAAPKKKRVAIVDSRGHTVFTSRDEDGRRRTRIIIQKRSYLDPGTEVLPGDEHNHDYAFQPSYSATDVLNNTAFGRSQSALPGPFDLPGRNNPWLRF